MNAIIARLQSLASQKCWSDNEEFMVNDYAGGNLNDAFSGGVAEGEIQLARDLLDELEKLGLVHTPAAS